MVSRDLRVLYWRAIASGLSFERAASASGVSYSTGRGWFQDAGGVIPRHLFSAPSPRYLDAFERQTIQLEHSRGTSLREIGRMLNRPASTISRELTRNSVRGGYDARTGQRLAEARVSRPKAGKLVRDPGLNEYVQHKLDLRWSPRQISRFLPVEFPESERMRVSHETIYRAIYVQAKGTLRRDLEVRLRTGRQLRKPQKRVQQDGRAAARIPNMLNISGRPAEVADRAVPGHWEGDLIMGASNKSQIGTLVERATRNVMLLHLPNGSSPELVADAMIAKIRTLPAALMQSVTWDQGREMAAHERITFETDVQIYFCDPHSPWQRGTNENTNGLLRQYFPKGTDLSLHSAEYLDFVANQLNDRPRETLGMRTPAQAMTELLLAANNSSVATTD
jgi:IS30 family transposase